MKAQGRIQTENLKPGVYRGMARFASQHDCPHAILDDGSVTLYPFATDREGNEVDIPSIQCKTLKALRNGLGY